jgi:8-oxo-dGTP pyrophosphatase MutT (NUDIX family)
MVVRLGATQIAPPEPFASSVMAIVLHSGPSALFLWPSGRTGNISHFLIGGRALSSECPGDTVRREVGEETGWQVEPERMVGYRHFHQLSARSAESDRPYPDFIQSVFAARAVAFDERLIIPGDRIPAEIVDYRECIACTEVAHRPLLKASLDRLAADLT